MSDQLARTPDWRHPHVPIDLSLNVRSHVHRMQSWKAEYDLVYADLQSRIDQLDSSKSAQLQQQRQLLEYQKRMMLMQVREPLRIHSETIEELGFPALREHLANQFVRLTASEKKDWLRTLFYIETNEVLDLYEKIQRVRHYLTSGQSRNFTIGGKSGMGKTTFLNALVFFQPPKVEAEYNYVPVIKVDAPVGKSPRALSQRLILEMGKTYLKSDEPEELLSKVVVFFSICRTEVAIVDEIEHLAHYETRRRLLEISNLAPRIVFICASVNPQRWLDGDEEAAGRWDDSYTLEPFEGERLQELLSYIDLILPFARTSQLADFELRNGPKKADIVSGPAKLIASWTKGSLKNIMMLIHDASELAIEQNLPCLTPNVLEAAHKRIKSSSSKK